MPHGAIGPGSLVASRFRLEDLLEESAGARLWRATDLTLARSVALHVVDGQDPRARAVLTAARTSATVSDPHILRVLDALEEGGLVHIVHEWGSGTSLDRMLAGDVVEPRRAAWLVREVAEAITAAHHQGVAHGRLLPENVLLTDSGAVKLIGFVVDAVLHGRPGTRGELGPRPSEHESDVINLGALLYACLTGKWSGFPPSLLPAAPTDRGHYCRPRQVRPGVPRTLDALCDQLVNPETRDGQPRLETAAEVVAALNDFLGDGLAAPTVAVPERVLGGASGLLDDPDATRAVPLVDDPDATRTAAPLSPLSRRDTAASSGSSAATATEPALPRGSAAVPPAAVPLASRVPGTGMGGQGAVPPVWGPDPGPDPVGEDTGTEPMPWIRLAAVVAVLGLLLLAVVVGFTLGRSATGENGGATKTPARGPTATAAGKVLRPAAVRDFDPDQDGGRPEENPQLVALATDGDPETAWETLSYREGPALAPYKSGVGLLLDLGTETQVGEVRVTLGGGPYDLSLLAAPKGAATPTGTEGLRTVATQRGASGEVTLEGSGTVTTRYLVVWLTALPAGDGGYRGRVAEVVVRS